MEITTIKLKKDTKSRLDKLKTHAGETYEEVLKKVLLILNLCKSSPFQARSKLNEIADLRDKLKSSSAS